MTYSVGTRTATLQPTAALAYSTTYTARSHGRQRGVKDSRRQCARRRLLVVVHDRSSAAAAARPGPGGPILVVSTTANPFSRYYAEILRAEGLNAFSVTDISASLTSTVLNCYDVVILGEMPLTTTQVTMFTNWVTAAAT